MTKEVIWNDTSTVTIPKNELWKVIVMVFQDMQYSKDVDFKQVVDNLFEYIKVDD